MDVKATQLAGLQQALSQAKVDPGQGRQGEFDHWRRIFDMADQREGHPPGRSIQGPHTDVAEGQSGAPVLAVATRSLKLSSPGSGAAGANAPPQAGQTSAIARLLPLVGQALPAALSAPAAFSGLAGTDDAADAFKPLQVETPAQARTGSACRQPSADARPLSQLEARLARQADGGLQVALRAPRALSAAQALHAVAQALAEQGETAGVNQVLLNGQPIYRSTEAPAHRFELDC